MKYAFRYYKKCLEMNKAEEIIIKYDETSAELIYFVKDVPAFQRVIIDITELEEISNDDIEIFKAAKLTKGDIAILCSYNQDYSIFMDEEIPFFFDKVASNLDEFSYIISKPVSDIYVGNSLGFFLEQIAPVCQKAEIRIRVYANIAQNSCTDGGPRPITDFFVRPDDLYIYKNYIDVIEFKVDNLEKQDILYKIYKDERWNGNLDDLILGLEHIDNTTVVPSFGQSRVGCRKKCTYGHCHICQRIVDVSDVLTEKDLHMIKRKTK